MNALWLENWTIVDRETTTPGRSWDVPSRPRRDKTDLIPRLLFEATPTP